MEQVRGMLREVVEEAGGTGKQARIPGMIVGGKTGTAQKADSTGKYGRGRVGSFVGMIPIEEPRYLICVLLDEPTKVQYGGIVAAPVFRHVALNTMAYHGLLPDSDDPAVQAIAHKEAERKNGKRETKAPVSGPKTASSARSGSGARTERSAPAADTVPAVVGMGLRSAVETFAVRGIVPVIKGRGDFVTRQTPEAGNPWPDGNRECTLWLEERAS
jgi:cell division protein FtsI (penicillin-binding protein 3)